MKVFIWKNGRAEAQQGYNDDLTMSFATAMFMRDTSFKFRQNALDSSRAALSNITKVTNTFSGVYNRNSSVPNPYEQEVNGQKESIRWLL